MIKILSMIVFVVMFALPAWADEEAGLIKIAKGDVNIERSAQKMKVSAGMPVFSGDKIATGADSSVGITLRDNTLLSVGPKSILILNRFAFNSVTHAGNLDASVKRGTLSVVSGKLTKNSPGNVKFRTPVAILGARGTEFVIDAGSGEGE